MDPKAEEALARISDQEWKDLILALARYTLSVSRNLRWRTRNPVELPGGETVDSIVSKAIEKVYSGERAWHPDAHPDLKKYLRDVIDSLLSHLAESQENVLLRAVPEPDSRDAPAWESGSEERERAADWLVGGSRSPEDTLRSREQAALEDHALELLLEECASDPVLLDVLEATMDGYEKPADISNHKGIPVKDVYKANKRLDTKLEAVRQRITREHMASAERKGV